MTVKQRHEGPVVPVEEALEQNGIVDCRRGDPSPFPTRCRALLLLLFVQGCRHCTARVILVVGRFRRTPLCVAGKKDTFTVPIITPESRFSD